MTVNTTHLFIVSSNFHGAEKTNTKLVVLHLKTESNLTIKEIQHKSYKHGIPS